VAVLTRALNAAVGTAEVNLADLFTEDVQGWSPSLSVSSLNELQQAYEGRTDAFSDVSVVLTEVTSTPARLIAEWRLSGHHTGELILDDDVLPVTGKRVELAGAMFAEFRAGRICSFRNYFDDLALLEQLLIEVE
jgi:predicted ester cyclase